MDDEKKCSKCKAPSANSKFYKDCTKMDGYRPECINWFKQYQYKKREKEIYVKSKG